MAGRSVTASGTSLDSPGTTQVADQIKDEVEIFGGVGRGNSYFDPFAFAPVPNDQPRFGTAKFNSLRGPGHAQWDAGLFRQISFGNGKTLQLRLEGFNITNRPHFDLPGANRSSLRLNQDDTIRDLNGYTEITRTIPNDTRSERQVRLGIRFGF